MIEQQVAMYMAAIPVDELENIKLLRRQLNEHQHYLLEYQKHHLTDRSQSQRIIAGLVPQTHNLALAILELIELRFLYPAEVLLRPYAERIGTIAYFAFEKDKAVTKWEQGWTLKIRPKLVESLEYLPEKTSIVQLQGLDWETIRNARSHVISKIDSLHVSIHGAPQSLETSVTYVAGDTNYYCLGPDFQNVEYADRLAHMMLCLSTFFPILLINIFPDFCLIERSAIREESIS